MPTIALVDDDRNILTSVSIALETEGYRIQTYTDGASALDGLKHSPPDLAIFDIKMPRMDGMELLRRLRQKSDLPVIFLTSKDEEIDELFGLKMGADDFIHKPFSQRLLVERVKAVLRRFAPKDGPGAPAREADAAARSLERGMLMMDPEREHDEHLDEREAGGGLRAERGPRGLARPGFGRLLWQGTPRMSRALRRMLVAEPARRDGGQRLTLGHGPVRRPHFGLDVSAG